MHAVRLMVGAPAATEDERTLCRKRLGRTRGRDLPGWGARILPRGCHRRSHGRRAPHALPSQPPSAAFARGASAAAEPPPPPPEPPAGGPSARARQRRRPPWRLRTSHFTVSGGGDGGDSGGGEGAGIAAGLAIRPVGADPRGNHRCGHGDGGGGGCGGNSFRVPPPATAGADRPFIHRGGGGGGGYSSQRRRLRRCCEARRQRRGTTDLCRISSMIGPAVRLPLRPSRLTAVGVAPCAVAGSSVVGAAESMGSARGAAGTTVGPPSAAGRGQPWPTGASPPRLKRSGRGHRVTAQRCDWEHRGGRGPAGGTGTLTEPRRRTLPPRQRPSSRHRRAVPPTACNRDGRQPQVGSRACILRPSLPPLCGAATRLRVALRAASARPKRLFACTQRSGAGVETQGAAAAGGTYPHAPPPARQV